MAAEASAREMHGRRQPVDIIIDHERTVQLRWYDRVYGRVCLKALDD